MTKDAYYFSHDSNAHKDPKCIRLRRLAGMSAYGLFWCVIEMLRDAPENKIPLESRDDILFELRCETKEWDALFQSGLIVKDEEFFWSESLLRRMDRYHGIVEKRTQAGKKSAEKRQSTKYSSSLVQQMMDECSTSAEQGSSDVTTKFNKGKERKGKETKEKKDNQPSAEVIPENLNHPDFLKTWEAWKTYRTEKKKKLTPTGISMQLKKFSEWGIWRSIAAIEHTMFSGWEGIREPDPPKPGAPQPYYGEFLNAEEEEIEKAGEYYQKLIDAEAEQERLKKEAEENEINA